MTAISAGGDDIAVQVENVSRYFGPVRALHDVSLQARAGDLTAVMGENGAGKSTLMKILAGLQPPSAGTVTIRGEAVRRYDPAMMLNRFKIALVPQELTLAQDRTVAENVLLGVEPGNRWAVSGKRLVADAAGVLEELGAPLDPRLQVRRLDLATQQLVVIARALARRCDLLILDEPTAMLTPAESDRLFELLRKLRTQGTTLIYVSHRMPEVFALSDHIHVLRDGRHVSQWRTSDTTPDEVVAAMVGRELASAKARVAHTHHGQRDARLELRGLSGPGFSDVDLLVRPGEIVGLAGLPDSGRVELLRSVFGADPVTSGTTSIDGVPMRFSSPRAAINAGIAYVPGERRHQGIFPTMSVSDNIGALTLDRASTLGFVRRSRLRRDAQDRARSMSVKMGSVDQAITSLSGGNQQKALLARWLSISPRLLLLDDPTRGVDVGAKAEIYTLFDTLTADGLAVLVSSSDLPELLTICDRIVVMRAGRVVGTVTPDTSEESIMALATGADTLQETV